MKLQTQLRELIQACFTGIWIESHEPHDALTAIAELCRAEQWRLVSWNIDQGLRVGGQPLAEEGSDPLAALRSLRSLAASNEPNVPQSTLLVLENFHRFLQSPEIVQAVAGAVQQGKSDRTFVIILAPLVQLPLELEKAFVIVEHELPDREQLAAIARQIATEEGELPSNAELSRLLDAAAGLTRAEAESAYSLSLVRDGQLTPDAVWELKSGMLKKSGLLQLHRGGGGFDELGGLESLKTFCRRALLRSASVPPRARPRGVMLLGLPGTGKSAFCQALGRETGRPTLSLDIGALLGSLVGQTEANIRRALQIADCMAPCICFVDEIEKALSGVGSQGDGGVAARLFGTLLTWMNDHTSDVFLVATCNDISKLPPEFVRAERFDGIFFLDLPSDSQRQAIWQIYLRQFELEPQQRRPDDRQWTGAEIKACCRLAALLDVPLLEAAQHVVPVAVTGAETIERLRGWANGRCLSSDRPGLYQRAPVAAKTRRAVARPTEN